MLLRDFGEQRHEKAERRLWDVQRLLDGDVMGVFQSEGKDLRRQRRSAVVVVEEEGTRGAFGREAGV